MNTSTAASLSTAELQGFVRKTRVGCTNSETDGQPSSSHVSTVRFRENILSISTRSSQQVPSTRQKTTHWCSMLSSLHQSTQYQAVPSVGSVPMTWRRVLRVSLRTKRMFTPTGWPCHHLRCQVHDQEGATTSLSNYPKQTSIS